MPEWLNARPVSATIVVPGTERTREHPEQAAAPKLRGEASHPLRPRQQREPDPAEVVKVAGRAIAEAPSNMERPGTSQLRRRLAAHSPAGLVPSAFPAPMSSLLTGEKSGAVVSLGANQPRGGMLPVHPSRAAEVVQAPADPGFNERLDAAKGAFDAAAREHGAAPGAHTQDAVRAAAADLDAVLSSAQLRNLGASARMHTATRVRLDFALGELDRIDQRLAAAGPQHQPTLDEVVRQRPAVRAAAEGARQIQDHHDTALNAAGTAWWR